MDKAAGEADHTRRMDELAARDGCFAERTTAVEDRERAVEEAERWQSAGAY